MGTIHWRLLLVLVRTRRWWSELDLNARLTSAASLFAFCGLIFIAMFAASNIEDAIVQKSASATARYMDSFVVRHVQELAATSTLSAESQVALEKLLAPAAIGRPIVSFRIWRGDTVVFSNRRELIGRSFPSDGSRNLALDGTLVAEFGELDDDDNEHERALKQPLLEIYAPVYETGTGRVIAVAETYELAESLRQEIRSAQLVIWLIVGAIAAVLVYFVPSLVRRAARERGMLTERIGDLTQINAENESFRDRVKRVNNYICEMHERQLRSFGSELHDGPMQLVSLALLKVDYLHELVAGLEPGLKHRADEIETIRDALVQSLDAIRRLMISVEPNEIENLALVEVIGMAARQHMHRTGAKLTFEADDLPEIVSLALQACLYRLVNEALDLSFAGVDGEVQKLRVGREASEIRVEIVGSAKVPDESNPSSDYASRMKNLRDGVEAFGGLFRVSSSQGEGIVISANFNNATTKSAND